MARVCTICTHPDRAAIDAALVNREPYRHIASQFGTSTATLRRHEQDHIPAALAQAQQAAQVVAGDDLLGHVRDLQQRTMAILARAEQANPRLALLAIREARACLELLAKLLGEIDRQPQVNILISPEWLGMRTAILDALAPYGEARVALAGVLLSQGSP